MFNFKFPSVINLASGHFTVVTCFTIVHKAICRSIPSHSNANHSKANRSNRYIKCTQATLPCSNSFVACGQLYAFAVRILQPFVAIFYYRFIIQRCGTLPPLQDIQRNLNFRAYHNFMRMHKACRRSKQ